MYTHHTHTHTHTHTHMHIQFVFTMTKKKKKNDKKTNKKTCTYITRMDHKFISSSQPAELEKVYFDTNDHEILNVEQIRAS